MTVIVKNTTSNFQFIDDLGIGVEPNESINLSDLFSFAQIENSRDLKLKVQLGEIILNDGDKDLTPVEAVNQVTIESKLVDDSTPDIPDNSGGTSGGTDKKFSILLTKNLGMIYTNNLTLVSYEEEE